MFTIAHVQSLHDGHVYLNYSLFKLYKCDIGHIFTCDSMSITLQICPLVDIMVTIHGFSHCHTVMRHRQEATDRPHNSIVMSYTGDRKESLKHTRASIRQRIFPREYFTIDT